MQNAYNHDVMLTPSNLPYQQYQQNDDSYQHLNQQYQQTTTIPENSVPPCLENQNGQLQDLPPPYPTNQNGPWVNFE